MRATGSRLQMRPTWQPHTPILGILGRLWNLIKILAVSRKALGDDDPGTLHIAHNFASCLYVAREYEKAALVGKRVYDARKRILGPTHEETLRTANNLVASLSDSAKYAEAATLTKEIYEVRSACHGENDPSTIATVCNLAVILFDQGKIEESVSVNRKGLAACKRNLGETHVYNGSDVESSGRATCIGCFR